jgi:hypothetical protein
MSKDIYIKTAGNIVDKTVKTLYEIDLVRNDFLAYKIMMIHDKLKEEVKSPDDLAFLLWVMYEQGRYTQNQKKKSLLNRHWMTNKEIEKAHGPSIWQKIKNLFKRKKDGVQSKR